VSLRPSRPKRGRARVTIGLSRWRRTVANICCLTDLNLNRIGEIEPFFVNDNQKKGQKFKDWENKDRGIQAREEKSDRNRREFGSMQDLLIRFFIGGAVVSAFAVLGEIFKPKTFAGIFAAAPSVSLATIALTVTTEGRTYAATEARSMILGAVPFFAYAWLVSRLLLRAKWPTKLVTVSALAIWCICALGLWAVILR